MIVIYTNLLPERKAGLTIGPVILIQRRYKGDAGLLAHEKEHARQFWTSLGMSLILYPLSRRYRLWAESRAFAKQVNGSNIDDLAEKMARDSYRLGITKTDARKHIERWL